MSFADQLVERFEPWLTTDLETYLRQVASMFSEVELLAFDTDLFDGWTILFDPDRARVQDLPYLAQYVGERLPVGLSEAGSREWIKDRPNQRRGTPRSIFYAAQRRLTGSRLVSIKERDPGVDSLLVVTYTAETPDPAGTRKDIESVAPADVILTYEVRAGQSWGDLKAKTLAAPTGLTAVPSAVGGTLAGATYFYRVTALNSVGETIGSNEVSAVVPAGGTGSVALTWDARVRATSYRVYRGTSAGNQSTFYAPGNVTNFTDTGAAGTAGVVPAANTAGWTWADVAAAHATWADVASALAGSSTFQR